MMSTANSFKKSENFVLKLLLSYSGVLSVLILEIMMVHEVMC